ncbi:MAG: twin-arginine translocase TatA/TatE family subunit [Planctomycetes bacterium]|nr:twin-arginine translocase TatA/TatE family subunit [Planctomycetota bacterium]
MLPGGWEWIIVIVIVLLLFGGRKLPELARSVGKSIVEFKAGMKDKGELEEGEAKPAEKPEEKDQ